MKIKICGINDILSAKLAEKHGVDFLGFIFVKKSPRFVSLEIAHHIAKNLEYNKLKTVAVVIDPSNSEITDIVDNLVPDYLQLHGSESLERIREIRSLYPNVGLIKSLKIKQQGDLDNIGNYIDIVEYVLLDSAPPSNLNQEDDVGGGYGIKFDWSMLSNLESTYPSIKDRWILAGGINKKYLPELSQINPPIIDLSSSLEKDVGVKDPELIIEFLKMARNNTVDVY